MSAGGGAADARLALAPGTGPALHTATVVAPVVDLVRTASRNVSPECQLVSGQHFRVHAGKSGWSYGVALNTVDGRRHDYAGWVRSDALVAQKVAATHRVSALRAPVFSRADIKSAIRMSLPLGARVTGQGIDGDFVQVGGGGFVHRRHLAPRGGGWVEDWVDTVESFQGLPYVWGGNGPDGMDCSGLVKMGLESAGVACPRDADQQEAALGEPVVPDAELMNLRRGDLVFWPGHVGVMQTSGRLLHANAWHMGVATEPLRDAMARIGPIRTVKRLSPGAPPR